MFCSFTLLLLMVNLKESKYFSSILSILPKYFGRLAQCSFPYSKFISVGQNFGWHVFEVLGRKLPFSKLKKSSSIPSAAYPCVIPSALVQRPTEALETLTALFLIGRCTRLCFSGHPKPTLAREIRGKLSSKPGTSSPEVRHGDNSGTL